MTALKQNQVALCPIHWFSTQIRVVVVDVRHLQQRGVCNGPRECNIASYYRTPYRSFNCFILLRSGRLLTSDAVCAMAKIVQSQRERMQTIRSFIVYQLYTWRWNEVELLLTVRKCIFEIVNC